MLVLLSCPSGATRKTVIRTKQDAARWPAQHKHTLSSRYSVTMALLSLLNQYLPTDLTASLFLLCILAGLYVSRQRTVKYTGKCLPPGPPRLPVIGSLLMMPKDHEWLVYQKWSKEYGKSTCLLASSWVEQCLMT